MSHSEQDSWSDGESWCDNLDAWRWIKDKLPKFEQTHHKVDIDVLPGRLLKYVIRGTFRVAADGTKVWKDVAEAMMKKFVEGPNIDVNEFLLLFVDIAPGFHPLITHFVRERKLVWNNADKLFEFVGDFTLAGGIVVKVANDGVVFQVRASNYERLVFGDRRLATCKIAVSSGGSDVAYEKATKSIEDIKKQLVDDFGIRKNSGNGIVKVFFNTAMKFFYDTRTAHMGFPRSKSIVYEKTTRVEPTAHASNSKEGDSKWSEVSEVMDKLYECYGHDNGYGRIEYAEIPDYSIYFILAKDIAENDVVRAREDVADARYELYNFNIDILKQVAIDELKANAEEVLKDLETLSGIVAKEYSNNFDTVNCLDEYYRELSDAVRKIDDEYGMTRVTDLIEEEIMSYIWNCLNNHDHEDRKREFKKLRPDRIEKY